MFPRTSAIVEVFFYIYTFTLEECLVFIYEPQCWGLILIKYIIMLTFAIFIYVLVCFISDWNLIWPITLLVKGGLGDKAIAIIWGILLIAGLN